MTLAEEMRELAMKANSDPENFNQAWDYFKEQIRKEAVGGRFYYHSSFDYYFHDGVRYLTKTTRKEIFTKLKSEGFEVFRMPILGLDYKIRW
jgi:hypothetical protein